MAKIDLVRWGSQDRHNHMKRQQGLLPLSSRVKGLWRHSHQHDKRCYPTASEHGHQANCCLTENAATGLAAEERDRATLFCIQIFYSCFTWNNTEVFVWKHRPFTWIELWPVLNNHVWHETKIGTATKQRTGTLPDLGKKHGKLNLQLKTLWQKIPVLQNKYQYYVAHTYCSSEFQ